MTDSESPAGDADSDSEPPRQRKRYEVSLFDDQVGLKEITMEYPPFEALYAIQPNAIRIQVDTPRPVMTVSYQGHDYKLPLTLIPTELIWALQNNDAISLRVKVEFHATL